MRTKRVEALELLGIIPELNVIKVRHGLHQNWVLSHILSYNGKYLDLYAKNLSDQYFGPKIQDVVLKFHYRSYEYILNGNIIKKDALQHIISIEILHMMKYRHASSRTRFETSVPIDVELPEGKLQQCTMIDLSEGGAKIDMGQDIPLSSDLLLSIPLSGNKVIKTHAKVIKKKIEPGKAFHYGVKFVKVSRGDKKILHKSIEQLRHKNAYIGKEYRVLPVDDFKSEGPPVVIFSYDLEKSAYIGDALARMGLNHYFSAGSYSALKTAIFEEKPFLVIADGTSVPFESENHRIHEIADAINDLHVLYILKMEHAPAVDLDDGSFVKKNVELIFYPFLEGELEQTLLKYF